MRIPVVNEQDEIIGYKERNDKNPVDIIRASGLWITSPDGYTLLAQRSFKKKHGPGMWGPAVAGTVEEGETYESNIIKEAEEEIGLVDFVPVLGPKNRVRHLGDSYGNFFGQWFTTVVDRSYEFKKQEEEVEEIRWFSKDELNEFIKENPKDLLGDLEEFIKMFSEQ
ncbi:MAG: NUDIX domain-containing protein [bacterium]